MKKLIFDLDGTLLFISDRWKVAYQKFIDKYNLPITPSTLWAIIGDFEIESSGVVTKIDLCNYVNKKLSMDITEEMIKDLLDEYMNVSLDKTDIIYDVLEYLSKKYELIAYSNWFTYNQIGRLKNYDLDKFFTRIYGWDMLPIKPSKEGIESIVGSDSIEDYIMIGDSFEVDIVCPHDMGMATIFYNRKNISQNISKEIFNIEELKDIL